MRVVLGWGGVARVVSSLAGNWQERRVGNLSGLLVEGKQGGGFVLLGVGEPEKEE